LRLTNAPLMLMTGDPITAGQAPVGSRAKSL